MSLKNFEAYSAYYDLLYREKNYAGEAAFVDELIRSYCPNAKSILDLGCGTGIHDWLLAERGYTVEGIDQSDAMLERARARTNDHPEVLSKPIFRLGDLTNFQVESRPDVVVALFDVFSYLTEYDHVRAALSSLRASLRPGALVIFDCWYGPAVYTQCPGTRIKRLEDDRVKLTRIAEGNFDFRNNRIDVKYEIFVKSKRSGITDVISEVHPMRCYFEGELNLLFAEFGFTPRFVLQWFSKAPPSTESWSVLFGFAVKE